MENPQETPHETNQYRPFNGGVMVALLLLMFAFAIYMPFIQYQGWDGMRMYFIGDLFDWLCPAALLTTLLMTIGFTQVNPNESLVLTFFGTKKGVVVQSGFFWINPLMDAGRVSLRAKTLTTPNAKMADKDGTPIMVGAVLNYRVVNPEAYYFNADAPEEIVANAMEVVLRESVSIHPFDLSEAEMKDEGDKTSDHESDDEAPAKRTCLRQNSDQISVEMRNKIQKKLNVVGIRVLDARLSNISYAPEISGLMLLRQQAGAMVGARTAILKASVPLVRQVIKQFSVDNGDGPTVTFSETQKATLATNLLTVMVSEKGASPTIAVD
ncbi:SPFH domain-containing protein (plasmid) [Pseudomonas silesiensis]|uniref:SPFH domain-containing protein n=1 Tax=Pseudomonas silesiensis TaxID=1853130 RepID=UPI0030CECF8B